MKRRFIAYLVVVCEMLLALLSLFFAFDLGQQFRGMRNSLLVIAVMGVIWYAHFHCYDVARRRRRIATLLAVIYGLFWTIGSVMSRYDAVADIAHSKVWVIVFFIGSIILFRSILLIASKVIDAALEFDHFKPLAPIIGCIVVTLVSVFYLVAFYPGVTFFDGLRELQMWLGQRTWTNHDPVFATVLIGLCASIGRAILDDNLGMFIYVFLVTGASTWVFWRAFVLMRRLETPCVIGIGAMAYWSLLPIVHLYLITMCKDTPFALCTMMLVVLLMEMAHRRRNGMASRRSDLVKALVVMLLMCNFRNDGVWICVFTLLVVLVLSRGFRAVAAGGIVILMAFHVCYGALLLPAVGIGPGSPREAIAVPLQQIAFWTSKHPESLSEQDQAYIEQLFDRDAKELAALFDDHNADGVKNNFVYSPTHEDWKALAHLWTDGLKAEPVTFVRCYLVTHYAYLYPDQSGDEAGFTTYASGVSQSNVMDHHFMEWGKPLRDGVGWLIERFRQLPIISWLYCPGAYVWALLAAIALAFSRGRLRDTVPFAPLFAIFLIACLSPVNGRIRYVLSLVFCLPLVVAWTWHVVCGIRTRMQEEQQAVEPTAELAVEMIDDTSATRPLLETTDPDETPTVKLDRVSESASDG